MSLSRSRAVTAESPETMAKGRTVQKVRSAFPVISLLRPSSYAWRTAFERNGGILTVSVFRRRGFPRVPPDFFLSLFLQIPSAGIPSEGACAALADFRKLFLLVLQHITPIKPRSDTILCAENLHFVGTFLKCALASDEKRSAMFQRLRR